VANLRKRKRISGCPWTTSAVALSKSLERAMVDFNVEGDYLWFTSSNALSVADNTRDSSIHNTPLKSSTAEKHNRVFSGERYVVM
jgi:hypothetical protein